VSTQEIDRTYGYILTVINTAKTITLLVID